MLRTETATRTARAARKPAKATRPRTARRKQTAKPITAKTAARKSQPVELAANSTVHEAFAAIAAACRDHWDANHAAAVAGTNLEGIHQFRVGLRRFRTALTLFREHLPEEQRAWMKSEAKALGDLLSPARDLDVFLTELAPQGRRDQATKTMLQAAQASRQDAQMRVAAALAGARYRRFLSRLNLWLDGTAWRGKASGGETPAEAFARTELNRRLAKIQKRSKHVDTAPPADLHALRIAIKKLRYGLEFFQSLLPPRRTARIGRLLKSLQDSLGKLNDLDVAQRTVTTLASRAGSAAVRHPIETAGARLSTNFKPLAKTAQPEATRIAARLRAQKLL